MKNQIKNKYVIFDWGGVIESHTDGEYNIESAIISLFKRLNNKLSDEQILKIYNESYQNDEGFYISELDNIIEVEKCFERIKKQANFKCNFKEFCQIYKEETFKVDYYKKVVEFAHSLKDKCKIAILSNLNYLDKDRIDMQVHLKEFDYIFLSFELKCRKPNPKIYEIVERDLNTSCENILFIDDCKENIISAKKRNWNTCQACGYELDKIKKAVNQFLSE